jgi:hypothetical protein
MLPLVIEPARVKNMFEITMIVGAAVDGEAVDDMESCTALAMNAPEKEAEAEVKHRMTSKLLVCKALIKVSMRQKCTRKAAWDTNLGQQTLLLDATEKAVGPE